VNFAIHQDEVVPTLGGRLRWQYNRENDLIFDRHLYVIIEQYRSETRSADWGLGYLWSRSEPTKNMKKVPRTNMMLDPWLPILWKRFQDYGGVFCAELDWLLFTIDMIYLIYNVCHAPLETVFKQDWFGQRSEFRTPDIIIVVCIPMYRPDTIS